MSYNVTGQYIVLTIKATDQTGLSATTTLRIQVIDSSHNGPKFNPVVMDVVVIEGQTGLTPPAQFFVSSANLRSLLSELETIIFLFNIQSVYKFTSKVWTDDSKLLQESNLAARQQHRAPHHVIQTIASEGLTQGLYVMRLVMESNQRPSEPKAPNTTTLPIMPLVDSTAMPCVQIATTDASSFFHLRPITNKC